ncbi:YcxB family protein [Micromonospora eburnea]|uniref:YcxB-like protein n=1 Tax=Micromonospora eburnea TaxID=227316 RepID=A0A1C6UVX1_9ACTN|nr:YcxB family protein [Micromonospora eburnea]SCL58148.1 YcxB-like protein [Micromonospora eburnea]
MQISMWVPYDERQLRRTLRFILRPQLRSIRILGGVLIVLGLAPVALDPSRPLAYVALVLGVLLVSAIAPITVAWSMRIQSNAIRDGHHLILDDEWVTLAYPLAESRLRWAGLGRVIETPEVWYVMFGRVQAVTIPKGPMTQEQRAEFAAFVDGLQPAGSVGQLPPSRR